MAPPVRPGSAGRLAALARIANARSEADLARLATTSARLNTSQQARDELEAALHAEIRATLDAPELPSLRALDRHILLAEQARAALERRIAQLAADQVAERAKAAQSFGRARVLDRLHTQVRSQTGQKLR